MLSAEKGTIMREKSNKRPFLGVGQGDIDNRIG
jgi:hypothetical protein